MGWCHLISLEWPELETLQPVTSPWLPHSFPSLALTFRKAPPFYFNMAFQAIRGCGGSKHFADHHSQGTRWKWLVPATIRAPPPLTNAIWGCGLGTRRF